MNAGQAHFGLTCVHLHTSSTRPALRHPDRSGGTARCPKPRLRPATTALQRSADKRPGVIVPTEIGRSAEPLPPAIGRGPITALPSTYSWLAAFFSIPDIVGDGSDYIP